MRKFIQNIGLAGAAFLITFSTGWITTKAINNTPIATVAANEITQIPTVTSTQTSENPTQTVEIQLPSVITTFAQETPTSPTPTSTTIATHTSESIEKTPIPTISLTQKVTTQNIPNPAPQQAQTQTNFPTSISIPAISFSSSIIPVDLITIGQDRTWEVPNNTVGTPREQVQNNIILLGHSGLYNSIFGRINELTAGQKIIVNNTNKYSITSVSIVDAYNISSILPQNDPTLTIVTCEGSLRRIVVAKPI
ncbi:MAG: sortase [bacterium]